MADLLRLQEMFPINHEAYLDRQLHEREGVSASADVVRHDHVKAKMKMSFEASMKSNVAVHARRHSNKGREH